MAIVQKRKCSKCGLEKYSDSQDVYFICVPCKEKEEARESAIHNVRLQAAFFHGPGGHGQSSNSTVLALAMQKCYDLGFTVDEVDTAVSEVKNMT